MSSQPHEDFLGEGLRATRQAGAVAENQPSWRLHSEISLAGRFKSPTAPSCRALVSGKDGDV